MIYMRTLLIAGALVATSAIPTRLDDAINSLSARVAEMHENASPSVLAPAPPSAPSGGDLGHGGKDGPGEGGGPTKPPGKANCEDDAASKCADDCAQFKPCMQHKEDPVCADITDDCKACKKYAHCVDPDDDGDDDGDDGDGGDEGASPSAPADPCDGKEANDDCEDTDITKGYCAENEGVLSCEEKESCKPAKEGDACTDSSIFPAVTDGTCEENGMPNQAGVLQCVQKGVCDGKKYDDPCSDEQVKDGICLQNWGAWDPTTKKMKPGKMYCSEKPKCYGSANGDDCTTNTYILASTKKTSGGHPGFCRIFPPSPPMPTTGSYIMPKRFNGYCVEKGPCYGKDDGDDCSDTSKKSMSARYNVPKGKCVDSKKCYKKNRWDPQPASCGYYWSQQKRCQKVEPVKGCTAATHAELDPCLKKWGTGTGFCQTNFWCKNSWCDKMSCVEMPCKTVGADGKITGDKAAKDDCLSSWMTRSRPKREGYCVPNLWSNGTLMCQEKGDCADKNEEDDCKLSWDKTKTGYCRKNMKNSFHMYCSTKGACFKKADGTDCQNCHTWGGRTNCYPKKKEDGYCKTKTYNEGKITESTSNWCQQKNVCHGKEEGTECSDSKGWPRVKKGACYPSVHSWQEPMICAKEKPVPPPSTPPGSATDMP